VSSVRIDLAEYELTWSELESLPKDHIALFSVLSYALSEINVFRKLYVSVAHPYIQVQTIDSANNINKFALLRTWGSKLFEIAECLRVIHKKNETSDVTLLELAQSASTQFEPLRQGEGMQVARYIRNEAAHHYSFSSARENLGHVSYEGDFNFYTHDVGANDFFPIGEEVLFHGRLNRKWKSTPSKADRDALFGKWLDWNLDATEWLHETHAKAAFELIFSPLGRSEFKEKPYRVPENFVGDVSRNRMPIFYVKGTKT